MDVIILDALLRPILCTIIFEIFLLAKQLCTLHNSKVTRELKMGRSLVELWGLVESVTKMVTGCLRATKVAIFFVQD